MSNINTTIPFEATAAETERIVTEYADRIAEKWASEPEVAATDRRPLPSLAGNDFEPTESQYAAAVQLILEDEGIEDAHAHVLANRAALSDYRDGGAEPDEVVRFILGR